MISKTSWITTKTKVCNAEIAWCSMLTTLQDLQRMYSLLARIPEGLDPLRKKFEEHVKKAGLAAIAKLHGEAANSPGGEVVSYRITI
jgi:cullin 1